MRLVVLQPAGGALPRAHYQDTVANLVDLQAHGTLLGPDLPVLQALHPSGFAALWGATPGRGDVHVRKWQRMSPGDFVLFTEAGGAFAGATVTHTFRNEPLADALWQRDDKNQTWELMFALDELRGLQVTYAELNGLLGYSPNKVVQGFTGSSPKSRFTVLNEGRSAAIFDYLSVDSDMHPPAPTGADLAARIAALPAGTEAEVTVVRRLEQALLRRTLLPGNSGSCDLCGQTYPVQFLVAAHIKKRAACSAAERLDMPHVAMVACKFGCDALFEEGYLGVSRHGKILVSPHAPRQGAAAAYLGQLAGRDVPAHTRARQKYYGWHRHHTYKASLTG